MVILAAITAGRNGSKLKPTAGGTENTLRFEGNRLAFRNYSIAALAGFLSRMPAVDRRIEDASGLNGGFDFDLVMDVADNAPDTVKRAMLEWPSLFSDLEQQLGLKLESRKAAVDMFVVDRVERPQPN
jgi:uncharacterized protein (TIGR03435 family)